MGPGFQVYSIAEAELAKKGIKQQDMLSNFLKEKNNPIVLDLLGKTQFSFLVPPTCALRDLNDKNATTRLPLPTQYNSKERALLYAVVLQNLARIEIVVTTDKLDTLIPQINRHGTRKSPLMLVHQSGKGYFNTV